MTFTHQGASWIDQTKHLHDVRYPGDWNMKMIDELIKRADTWSEKWKVPLIADEFGVYHDGGARRADMLAYLHDVRTSLEAHGISWTLWDYGAGFGIASGSAGSRTLDKPTLKALGLETHE